MTAPALNRSNVDAGIERVLDDEIASRFNRIPHQLGEDVVGIVSFADFHLQQQASIAIKRRLPQLFGVHFAKALIALQRD